MIIYIILNLLFIKFSLHEDPATSIISVVPHFKTHYIPLELLNYPNGQTQTFGDTEVSGEPKSQTVTHWVYYKLRSVQDDFGIQSSPLIFNTLFA